MLSQKKRLYTVLEVKKRELDSRLYFAVKAAERGFSTVISKKNNLNNKVDLMKTGILLDKSLGPKHLKPILKFKKAGHRVCSFDEEGLLFYNPETLCKSRMAPDCLNEIDYFFCWGENDRNAILNYCTLDPAKVIKTGNCRIDFLKGRLKNILTEDAKKIKEKYGKFILCNTNFSYVNYQSPSENIKTIIDSYKILGKRDDQTLEVDRKKLNVQMETRKKLLEFFKIFSERFPDKKILIRAHQSENVEYWNESLKSYKNINLVKDHSTSAATWMLASELNISSNCTTGVESKILNTLTLNYLPVKEDISYYNLPNKINKNISSNEELLLELEKLYSNQVYEKNSDNDKINYIKKYVYNADSNIDSAEIMLNFLDKVSDNLIIVNEADKKSNFFYNNFFKLERYIKNLYHKTKKNSLSNTMYDLYLRKNPGWDFNEVKNRILKIAETLNIENLKVFEIYPNMICIEKNN